MILPHNLSFVNLGFFFFILFFAQDRVSLCSLACLGSHCDQTGCELRDLPVFASQVQELKVCTTTQLNLGFLKAQGDTFRVFWCGHVLNSRVQCPLVSSSSGQWLLRSLGLLL